MYIVWYCYYYFLLGMDTFFLSLSCLLFYLPYLGELIKLIQLYRMEFLFSLQRNVYYNLKTQKSISVSYTPIFCRLRGLWKLILHMIYILNKINENNFFFHKSCWYITLFWKPGKNCCLLEFTRTSRWRPTWPRVYIYSTW